MTSAAISLVAYGIYLLANGLGLLLVPDLALSIIGLPISPDAWIRVVGLLAGEIGFYYVYVGLKGASEIYTATILGRIAAAFVFGVLVFSGIGPVQLLLFAAVDILSVVWTYLAVRKTDFV